MVTEELLGWIVEAANLDVAASGVLTSSGVNVTALDTVTVGGKTYTFEASVSTTANQVLKGASAAASLVNLAQAIIAFPAGSGVTYGSLTTANANVTAVATDATHLTATAIVPGTAGNSISSTKSAATLSWANTTLLGGTEATSIATVTPIPAERHFITAFRVLYSAAVAAVKVHTLTYTPEGGVETVLHYPINHAVSMANFILEYPLKCAPNTRVLWTAASSGSDSIVGYAQIQGFSA